MTALKAMLVELIKEAGPMPMPRYMAECLSHPAHGFYMKQDPFGADAHFTTAPEVSQMFGELIGLWIGDLWTRQGTPKKPALIELGPGRGTLMADITRALKKVPQWPADTPIHFVEISPALKKEQATRHPQARWHRDISSIDHGGPIYCVANEFFDALPIRQFERTSSGWRERFVVLTDEKDFALAPRGPDVSGLIPTAFSDAQIGSVIEHCGPAGSIAEMLAVMISERGGAALFIDYGYNEDALGESFQAVQNHQYVDPFAAPGDADLTAHVNFSAIKQAAQPRCAVHGPTTQGAFLTQLGLFMRAQALGQRALEDANRLAADKEMGTLFKVLALTPTDGIAPAGFQP